ncbi:uncharacterized protein [Aegilops tauschii subsp. strangulata]|uniref:uncharacterized protein isoform X1 n=1 Tax=Aegilops tauschii subsp. strangulata TaxID=200361 RepID=UPI00098B0D5C|nr:uncharacterized protein LOC109784814 isoform X1 [Aegilops tauschii subsp. strangulata]XP_044419561.1 uncharacterized protein LOC123144472 isoform X1 [Triticum aestivum]
MARAPHQLPPTLRRISRTTTGPSMARAPTPAPPASPGMARAVGRPCSCPAPVVSLSRLFQEVAHRKKAVSPKKKYRRPTLVATIRRRPYLDGCLLEAKLVRGCGNPAFLASTQSAYIQYSIHQMRIVGCALRPLLPFVAPDACHGARALKLQQQPRLPASRRSPRSSASTAPSRPTLAPAPRHTGDHQEHRHLLASA